MLRVVFCLLVLTAFLHGKNQTPYVTMPLKEDELPYRLLIEEAPFSLPVGLHSCAAGRVGNEWVLISGRTYGLHGFSKDNFPLVSQNTSVFVLNLETGATVSRSLLEEGSGLSQAQIDRIAVTSCLFFQPDGSHTLYIVGGYGYNTKKNIYETKPSLLAVDLPNLIKWVKRRPHHKSAAKCMRWSSHPLLQVTGGALVQASPHEPFLITLGQNFNGQYFHSSNGIYTKQVRPFHIIDDGMKLSIKPCPQAFPKPTYRRRDLNVAPIIKQEKGVLEKKFVALGGVFTPGKNYGVWTIPIEINADGTSSMINSTKDLPFAQGMNLYQCPTVSLYSERTGDNYILLFGGISFLCSQDGGYYSRKGCFIEDFKFGFTNDVTTIQIDAEGNYQQYFMSTSFPPIKPTFGTHPGLHLLFGTNALFLPNPNLPLYANGVVVFDQLEPSPILLGYIVGGIESAMEKTKSKVCNVDTHASKAIFKVLLDLRYP